MIRRLLFLGVALLAVGPVLGQGGSFDVPFEPGEPEVKKYLNITAIPSHTEVTAGEDFYVAVDMRIAAGWVMYGPNPGGPAKPAGLEIIADLKVG
ncbi:MAG: hypothetical protein K8S55_04085, partial [Phycisphaerae bacterium]|nr:hypothetical protein [Phycisphaerae bacterium]